MGCEPTGMTSAEEARVEMIRTMIDATSAQPSIYRMKRGSCPLALSDRVTTGICKETPKDAWLAERVYERTADGFMLGSYGAGGENADLWSHDGN